MEGSKAPGLDGFHAAFFQRNWNIMGGVVTNACLKVINHCESISGWNSTYVCLLPKSEAQKDFRVSTY